MTKEDELRQQLIAAALKQKLPLAALDPTCKWTTSADESAVEALNRAPGGITETGGALFENERGEFCYSIPVGGGKTTQFAFKVKPESGMKMVGLYHTHPKEGMEADSLNFSPDDVDMANKLKMTSYIKTLRDGAVKRYTPGDTLTSIMPRGVGKASGRTFSRGDQVVPPDPTLVAAQ